MADPKLPPVDMDEQRAIAQRMAERLGLRWCLAGFVRIDLEEGSPVRDDTGAWQPGAKRTERQATDADIDAWTRAIGMLHPDVPAGSFSPWDIAKHLAPNTPIGQGMIVSAIKIARQLAARRRPIPNDPAITVFLHCVRCLKELRERPTDISPSAYARLIVGYTAVGLQVWCARHDCNVLHVDFQGAVHPANTTCPSPPVPSTEKPS